MRWIQLALLTVPIIAPVTLTAQRTRADSLRDMSREIASCGPMDKMDGDSIYAKLSVRIAKIGASASVQALAAASDAAVIDALMVNVACRLGTARTSALGADATMDDGLSRLIGEVSDAFNSIESLGDQFSSDATARAKALDSVRLAHLNRLRLDSTLRVRTPRSVPSVYANAAAPYVDLLNARSVTGGIEVSLPNALAKILGTLQVSAGKARFAVQGVSGDVRLVGESIRANALLYERGTFTAQQMIQPIVASVYTAARQIFLRKPAAEAGSHQ